MKAKIMTIFVGAFLGLVIMIAGQNGFDLDGWGDKLRGASFFRNTAAAAPNLLTTVQHSKQNQTVAEMLAISKALSSYHVDFGIFPVFSLETSINGSVLPKSYYTGSYRDAWGTPFRYVTDVHGYEYTLFSLGKDRVKGAGTSEFDANIVMFNGQFLVPATVIDQCSNFTQTANTMRTIGTAIGSY